MSVEFHLISLIFGLDFGVGLHMYTANTLTLGYSIFASTFKSSMANRIHECTSLFYNILKYMYSLFPYFSKHGRIWLERGIEVQIYLMYCTICQIASNEC